MKVDSTAAIKALLTWVDLGVLKEEDVNHYKLLEVAEEAPAGTKTVPRPGTHAPPCFPGGSPHDVYHSHRGRAGRLDSPAAASGANEGILEGACSRIIRL